MQKLTKAEEEIMQLFWTHGSSTVSGLIGHMEEPHPPHSTISSIVRILEKKEFLDHKAYGRTYEYIPIIEKANYSKFSIRRLVSTYFEGSMNELVSFLVKENDMSLKELTEVVNKLENEQDQ